MAGIAYVDGRYRRKSEAAVHIEDRGFQFGDAVYDVWYYINGTLADFSGHMDRLKRSLDELGMAMPMGERALKQILLRVARANRLKEGIVYLQISRGSAPRSHAFPKPGTRPTLVVTAKSAPLAVKEVLARRGVTVITCPDERWGRCDIKSINLLPNVLAKEAARTAGAFETWMVDEEGMITEGTSTTAWIIDNKNRVVTRYLDHRVLPGVTRAGLSQILKDKGVSLEEQSFSPSDVFAAREAFLTSATNHVMPVVSLDGTPIGNGKPGPIVKEFRRAWLASLS